MLMPSSEKQIWSRWWLAQCIILLSWPLHAADLFTLQAGDGSWCLKASGRQEARRSNGELGYLANQDKLHVMYFGASVEDNSPAMFEQFFHVRAGMRWYGGNWRDTFVLKQIGGDTKDKSIEFSALGFGGAIQVRPWRFYRKFVLMYEAYYANRILSFQKADGFWWSEGGMQWEFGSRSRQRQYLYVGYRAVEMRNTDTNDFTTQDSGVFLGFGAREW